ncbi:MAG: 6-phosphofructokinase [Planctomycetota bacterium]
MRKIGILTGGGDAPGLNAAIRAVVLTAINELGLEVVGIRDGFGGFAEGDEGLIPLDPRSVRGLLWRGGSILACNNRYRGEPDYFVRRMDEIGLDGLVVAGGDGSLTVAQGMVDCGARVVGIPKTIDNDVAGTDQTFGFDTAVSVVTDACDRLIDTAESHLRVMVVEVMGRHAGHIALHGALAGGADVALMPEIAYRLESIAAKIRQRSERGRTYTLILAAEGAIREGGHAIVDEHRTHWFGREVLGGIAETLAADLRQRIDYEVRWLSLAHLQRGGAPSVFDRVLATRMGVAAARALPAGRSGVFTAYRNGVVTLAPLTDAAGKTRRVDARGRLVSAARAVGLSFGDE